MEIMGSVSGLLLASTALLLSWGLFRIIYAVWWKPMRLKQFMKKQGVDGPPFELIFGNARETMRTFFQAWAKPMSLCHDIVPRVLPFFHDVVEKYGRTCLVWYGNMPVLIVMSPDLVKEVLTNKFGQYPKTPPPPSMTALVTGLVALEGEKWAAHRKILNPAFHLEKLKGMLPTFSLSCEQMVQRWSELIGSQASREMDVFEELQSLTEDIISRTAFGSNFEEGKRLFEIQKEQAKIGFESLWKIQLPGFSYLPTKANIRKKKLNDDVTSILRGMVQRRIKEMKMGSPKKGDMLELLLESCNYNDVHEEKGSLKKMGMSIDDVIEECKLFYFAGQGTTGVTLTWTMVVLSMHPEWQSRAREEVLQVCGKGAPTFDQLSQLKIVTMVLYEVLRLYSPVVMLSRHASKRMQLGHLDIPAGVQLLLPLLFMQHDPELWGEDSNEFNPERFSEGVANAAKHQMAFYPFGCGPRICLGYTFAMMEAKMAVAMILQHFSFELSPSYIHAPCPVMTLQPQHGAPLIVHKL
ncbi:cytochrome P450 72A15-like [Nymphaea colorata]|nr:cytochrome P450 72A15-like [Nymphaea colorata]